MSYGIGLYGLGAFGGAGVSLALAFASSTHTVRVEFDNPVLQGYGFEDGSALRPSTWSVTNLATGQVYTVLGAEAISTTAVDILLLEALGPYQEQHRVSTTSLRSASGLLVTAPTSADFAGVVVSYDGQPDDVRSFRTRDLANPGLSARAVGFANTLQIGADGDYDTEEGEPLVRKLLIRRLTTTRGRVVHLPNYGIGLRVKEPAPHRGSLQEIKQDFERQALEEPEVERAQVGVSMSRDGIVNVILQVSLRADGTQIDLRLQANPKTGSVVVL